MPNINEIIRSCHQKLMRLSPSPEGTALEKLFGLFLKAEASFDSKRFLMRHLNTFLPFANHINADDSIPLAFEVHDTQTFLLAQIYLEFLTIFDENICSDANDYLDILSASPTWHAWLTKASAQMKYNLKIYYQLCLIDERKELIAQVDNPEVRNILALSVLLMQGNIENDRRQQPGFVDEAQHEKLSFEFRCVTELPVVPFQHATLICYASNQDEDPQFFYYPANSLRQFSISESLLFHNTNSQPILDYIIPCITIDEHVDRTTFHPEVYPTLLKHGENYYVYGKADDVFLMNEIDATLAQSYFVQRVDDFSELCDEIHAEGYHIPFIRYQDEYPIFERIQRILDEMFQYEMRYVGEEEIPFLEDRCIYVNRDAQMHTLSVSLKACSGQRLFGIETGIIATGNELTDEKKEAVLHYLKQAQLIPYLNSTQQAILQKLDEYQRRSQNAIDNHVPTMIKNIQHDAIKAFMLSICWNILGKTGLHAQVGQVFGVFNTLKLLNLGIKYHYELDIQSDDLQFGQSLMSKQDWGTSIKYAGLGLLLSGLMNRFGFNVNEIFQSINLLNLADSGRAVNHTFQDTNSRQFLNDSLSFGFSLLLLCNFNENLIRFLMLVQACFIYQQYQTTQTAQVVEQEHIQHLMTDKSNIQIQMEVFNEREQQARFLLMQMEDLLASLNTITTIADEHLIENIEPIQPLITQYLSFMNWRQNEYKAFLITLKNEHFIHDVHRYGAFIDEELERVRFSAFEMDGRFESFQQAVEAKKQELESAYQVQNIDIDALGWSWEWIYQPSTMISSGLWLASASLVGMYMMEFVLMASISALMLQIMVPALMLTTAVGIGLVCYGLNQLWEPEDLSVPPIPNLA